MTILIPYRDVGGRSVNAPVVSGGIERFIRHLRDELEDVHVFDITNYYYADPVQMKSLIEQKAKEIKADLIICNYPNEYLNVKLDFSPILWVCHHTAGLAIDASDAALRMKTHTDKGNALWMVSNSQAIDWMMFGKKRRNISLEISGIIPPSFVKQAKPHTGLLDYDLVTVGRCDAQKDPFLVHRWAKENYLRSLVMSASIDGPYRDANNHMTLNHQTAWNLPDDKVSVMLSRCMTYVVTWPDETFGIAAMEALAHGLPIIINSKPNRRHACFDLIPGSYWIGNGPNDIAKMKSISLPERNELAKTAYVIHSKGAWREKAKEMVGESIGV